MTRLDNQFARDAASQPTEKEEPTMFGRTMRFTGASRKLLMLAALILELGLSPAPSSALTDNSCLYNPASQAVEYYGIYGPQNPGGNPDDCEPLCETWLGMCKQFAVAQNNCVKTHYKAFIKLYGGYCKTEDSPAAKEECRAVVKAIRAEVATFVKHDTAAAKGMCEDMLDQCITSCAN
jgi:hypothetical protein